MELPENAPAASVLDDKENLVDHLIGGYVRASWKRVHVAIEARRVTFGAMFGEWYEWLYDRLEQYPAPGKKDGAASAFKAWKP